MWPIVLSQWFKRICTDNTIVSYRDHLTTLLKVEITQFTFSPQVKELENNSKDNRNPTTWKIQRILLGNLSQIEDIKMTFKTQGRN